MCPPSAEHYAHRASFSASCMSTGLSPRPVRQRDEELFAIRSRHLHNTPAHTHSHVVGAGPVICNRIAASPELGSRNRVKRLEVSSAQMVRMPKGAISSATGWSAHHYRIPPRPLQHVLLAPGETSKPALQRECSSTNWLLPIRAVGLSCF